MIDVQQRQGSTRSKGPRNRFTTPNKAEEENIYGIRFHLHFVQPPRSKEILNLRAAPIESECFLMDTDVAGEAEQGRRGEERRANVSLPACPSVCMCMRRWGLTSGRFKRPICNPVL